MPIGNLTSQIFANIYLNELDRFVKHELKVKSYLRYGDDFILIHENLENLIKTRHATIRFLESDLNLKLNPKNDKILKTKHGLKFLGVEIWPWGRRLSRRATDRAINRLRHRNFSSYFGLLIKHKHQKKLKEFIWRLLRHINSGN